MSHPVLIIISIIISLFAFLLLIIYLLNKKFRSYPCYFNIIFTLSITLDNLIRLIPGGKGDKGDNPSEKKTVLCHIQAFSLTLFDKLMLTLMTSYSIIAYMGSFHLYYYKTNVKKVFVGLTIVSFLISLITTLLFYLHGISNRSQYCYVETKDKFKQIVDSIVTSILLLISLYCIINLIKKILEIKAEKENEEEGENSLESIKRHLCRFIWDFIVTIITFGYVILLINKLLTFFDHFGKDLVYILLSLLVELFFTINSELIKEVIRILTCRKEEEDKEKITSLSDNYNDEEQI